MGATNLYLKVINIKKKKLMLMTVLLVAIGSLTSAAYINGGAVLSTPKTQWVSHTEYWSGDDVSTIVRLTDYTGEPFKDLVGCRATIMYPDKTVFVSDASLAKSTVSGNWFRTDIAPETQGTYEQQVTCTYGEGDTITTAQSFHINPALTRIQNISADVISQTALLTNVYSEITAQIGDTNESVTITINEAEMSVTDLVNTVNTDLSAQMTQLGVDVDTELTNVQTTLSADLLDTKIDIQSQLGNVETTLSDLVISLNNDLEAYLTVYLEDITDSLDLVYSDTQWLASNAMNQDNAASIEERFNTVDTNLALIENFCSNQETTTSGLCTEIYGLRSVVDTMRTEQTIYYEDVDVTTTSTWDFLSGSVASSLDTLLGTTETIQTQTTEINETLTEMRQEQVEKITMQVIS